MKDCLVIVIPAYNEEETIGAVLEEWYSVIECHSGDGRSRLLVVNDGSRDETEEKLEAFSLEHPLFTYITQKNAGHGAAIWNGYRQALKMGADYIFQTDSDGQTSATEFDAFWDRRKIADVVIGRRSHREDGKSRVFVSRVLGILIRIVFRVRVQDANCPYRLMNRKTLAKALRMVPKRFHLTNVILSVAFEKQRAKVLVLPILFRKRQGGVNSINIRKIIRIGWKAIGEFAAIERNFRRV